jgi:2-phosphosulfolactate phosphatase
VNYLHKSPYDILIHCAGWKGKVNMEDTLFAGALAEALGSGFENDSDAPLLATEVYRNAKSDLKKFLSASSHVQRLQNLGREEDIDFCLQFDKYPVIPVMRDGHIVRMTLHDMLF